VRTVSWRQIYFTHRPGKSESTAQACTCDLVNRACSSRCDWESSVQQYIANQTRLKRPFQAAIHRRASPFLHSLGRKRADTSRFCFVTKDRLRPALRPAIRRLGWSLGRIVCNSELTRRLLSWRKIYYAHLPIPIVRPVSNASNVKSEEVEICAKLP
jgi:hypothetical protein